MAKRQTFDLRGQIKKAFDFVWAWKQTKDGQGWGREGSHYYVTASEVEDRVRAAAQEQMDGKPYGTYGVQSSYLTVQIRTGTRMPLLQLCREFLLDEVRAGRLHEHNFKRGHISGARYRPVGAPFSPQEEAHFAKIKKEGPRGENKLVHASDPEAKGGWYSRKTLCSKAARDAAKPRLAYRPPSKSSARFASEGQPVTCPRCLKLLEEAKGAS